MGEQFWLKVRTISSTIARKASREACIFSMSFCAFLADGLRKKPAPQEFDRQIREILVADRKFGHCTGTRCSPLHIDRRDDRFL
jgi:hypothetical protein